MPMNNIHNEFSEIDEGSSNQAIMNLVEYIEKTLPDFPHTQEFVDILEKKKNENRHSQSFCVYMTNKCKSKYYFGRETAQKGSYTIDIGIFQGSNLIFTIEAKLLPTPKQNKGSEHQYVYGKGAGIQRFRDGFHGVDNQDNLLSENGMIAYIKEKDFDYWFAKVNQWVLDTQWDKSEQLKKIYFKQIGKLFSKHPRQNASDVNLYHFWIYVH
ncbi:MAG: hypothetical protein ACUZ8O_07175 [Candidatus Anammoxibacter sp.]